MYLFASSMVSCANKALQSTAKIGSSVPALDAVDEDVVAMPHNVFDRGSHVTRPLQRSYPERQ